MKASKRFASAHAWAGYVLSPYGGGMSESESDADIDAYVREQASTMFHPVGTASMSAWDAEWGVVDPDLKVKGVEGVRVVDASVFVSLSFFFEREMWLMLGYDSLLCLMLIRKDRLICWRRGLRSLLLVIVADERSFRGICPSLYHAIQSSTNVYSPHFI